MTERQPAMIIYTDGSTEQVAPLSIAFFESIAQAFMNHANQLKQQAVFAPATDAMPIQEENDDD